MTRFLKILFVSLLSATAARAAESTLGSAAVAARWLNLPASARVSAMGGAFTGLADDVNSLAINPAGLARLDGPQASFTHNLGLEGSSQDRLMGVLPAGAWGGFGAGINYVSFGTVERFAISSANTPVSNGSYNPYGLSLDLAWGLGLPAGFQMGAGLTEVMESLNLDLASATAVDLGLLWRSSFGLSAGASLQNLGGQLQGSDLPLRVRLGLAYQAQVQSFLLHIALDLIEAPRDREAPVELLGAELQPVKHFWLRAGYQMGNDNNPSGPTLGLGFADYGPLSVDYAFNAIGALDATQQISLKVGFGGPPAAPVRPSPVASPLPTVLPTPAVTEVFVPQAPSGTAKADLEIKVHTFVEQIKQANFKDVAAQAEALQKSAPEQAKAVLKETRVEAVQPTVFDGHYDEAEQQLEAMRSLNPKDSYVEEALGMMDWHQQKFGEARAHFRKAAALDPNLEYLIRWSK